MRTVTLIPLRRPKGKVQIQLGPKADPSNIWKDRADWLLVALGARWSHRHGYTLSPARAEAFVKLYTHGWSADRRILASHKTLTSYTRRDLPGEHSLKEALALCQ
jgi:hypothetical protein